MQVEIFNMCFMKTLSLWIILINHIHCQFYTHFFSRTYGPSQYDFNHYKPFSYSSPVNFIIPYSRPKIQQSQPPSSFYEPEGLISSSGLSNSSLVNNHFVPRYSSTILKSQNESGSSRDHRFLSLFTVVQFPKDICATSAGDNGTCLSPPDCRQKGGIVAGACANNFGVCCVFMVSCGQTTHENGTYFVNKGYPAGFNGTTSCQLSVDKISADVCQYRLDFEQFSLAGPEPINHICNYDQFIVSGSSPIPIICGINNGNHNASGPVVLSITTSGTEVSRYWKIRIIQISCSSIGKADEGCLQYFTGISGTIKSFNYEPVIGLHLSNQDYSICIRTERNFCSIQYSQCTDSANNRSHSFTLTGNTLGQNAVQSYLGSNNCNADWLTIPCASNVGTLMPGSITCVDRLCGGTLNAEPSVIPTTIYSTVKPFRLHFHTNSVESPDMGNIGFCLHYVQQPCNGKL
ncbi:hypothetical protein PGB90_007434 [Kerria lacca]